MEKVWEPCLEEHSWFKDTNGGYTCGSCGAKGWVKNSVALGRISFIPKLRVYAYKCKGCDGPTPHPRDYCPNCTKSHREYKGSPGKREAGRVIKSWKELTPDQQSFLAFLLEREKPTCVGRNHGGGSASFLSRHGLIEKRGDSSGQTKWVLSEQGLKVCQQSPYVN